MKAEFQFLCSAGRMKVLSTDDGNSSRYSFELSDGQFPDTEFKRTRDGVKITIIGEWEANEFIAALKMLKQDTKWVDECVKPKGWEPPKTEIEDIDDSGFWKSLEKTEERKPCPNAVTAMNQ